MVSKIKPEADITRFPPIFGGCGSITNDWMSKIWFSDISHCSNGVFPGIGDASGVSNAKILDPKTQVINETKTKYMDFITAHCL